MFWKVSSEKWDVTPYWWCWGIWPRQSDSDSSVCCAFTKKRLNHLCIKMSCWDWLELLPGSFPSRSRMRWMCGSVHFRVLLIRLWGRVYGWGDGINPCLFCLAEGGPHDFFFWFRCAFEVFMLMLPLVLGHADKTTLGRSGITAKDSLDISRPIQTITSSSGSELWAELRVLIFHDICYGKPVGAIHVEFPNRWSWISGRLWRNPHIFWCAKRHVSHLRSPDNEATKTWIKGSLLERDVEKQLPFVAHFLEKSGLSHIFFVCLAQGTPVSTWDSRTVLTLTIGVVPCRHTGISGALRTRRQERFFAGEFRPPSSHGSPEDGPWNGPWYPLVNQHSDGKSPSLIGKPTTNGPFSLANCYGTGTKLHQCFAGSELLARKGAAGAFHGCLWRSTLESPFFVGTRDVNQEGNCPFTSFYQPFCKFWFSGFSTNKTWSNMGI